MPRPRNEVPTYKLHSSTGLARCWVGGKWVTLGKYGSAESKAESERILAELRSGPPAAEVAAVPDAVTVDQLLLLFMQHAEKHYRRPNGTPTDQVTEFKNAAKPLHKIYGHTPAVQFGPKALKAVRQAYIDADNCRTLVNSRVGKIRRIFAWATEEELIPPSAHRRACHRHRS